MDDDGLGGLDKDILVKFAGLVLGIMLGSPIGLILFTPAGLNVPSASAAGSVLGAIIGYAATSAGAFVVRRRRDRELQQAAEAVRAEAGLPESVTIKVKDGRVSLKGEVETYAERQRAENIIRTLPGVKAVTNKIHLRPTAGEVTVAPDEIRRRIQDSFVRLAEQDGRGIRVLLNNSRLVLEGTVHSWAEAAEAENAAWNVPGVAEVENRLKIAA